MRKLASIQTIDALEPIPKADAIVKARVLGWSVVVKKGEAEVGDRVVYCEIDSLLPERPEFEFLRALSFKPALDLGDSFRRPPGFRIKTVKLRGQVSQGICFPLSVLPPGTPGEVGTDVTDILGVTKYVSPPPVGMGGQVRGGFPGFLPKTDETRIQAAPGALDRHRGRSFAVTEKLDGTSFTAYLREGRFGVCSRNLDMEPADETNMHANLARRLGLEATLRAIRERRGFDPAIQGEAIGAGIQGNKYARPDVELHVFNVYDITAGRYLAEGESAAILSEFGLRGVPRIGEVVLSHSVEELVALSVGPSALNPGTQREGLVFRPVVEGEDEELGGRLSFKVINPQFLLKYDE